MILDGFVPTMATRLQATGVQPQLWITSTEGTADSTFFNRKLDECRAGDQSRRTCWFDFGLPPDADPEDLDMIMRYHPPPVCSGDVTNCRTSANNGGTIRAAGRAHSATSETKA